METILTEVSSKLFEHGLLGIAVLVLGVFCYRLQNEVKALNVKLYEQSMVLTKALTENTIVLSAVVPAQERAAEASRLLNETIRLYLQQRQP